MVASIKNHKSATNSASHIKSPRLELIPQSMAFLKTTHAYAGDRENMRFMLHLPNDSEEATQEFLEAAEKEWKKVKPAFFEFAILKDGKHIGGVSVHLDKSRTSGELGWCLSKTEQGNGFAVEAANALMAWAVRNLSVKKFIAHCDSENIASWKTMEKLGMKRVSCTGGRYNKITPTEERKEFLYEMQEETD